MKLLIRKSDGQVLERLQDDDTLTIRPNFVRGPTTLWTGLSGQDIAVRNDLDTPDQTVNWTLIGDAFTNTQSGIRIEIPPPASSVAETDYLILTPLAFEIYVQTVAQLQDADIEAALNLAPTLKRRLTIATQIERGSALTTAALDAFIALGALTTQNKTDILDNWPRTSPS